MASLIIGTAFLITEKIRDRKEAKREAKRQAYEKRYKELEDEHKKAKQNSMTDRLEKVQTSQSLSAQTTSSDVERRPSSESQREPGEDGPAQWVNHVYLERQKSRSSA